MAAWAVAAVASGTYVASVALTAIEGARNEIAAHTGPGDAMRAVEAAEARALKFKVSLEEFQRDVAQLRDDAAGRSDAGLLARLTAIEERLSIETGVAVAAINAAAQPGGQEVAQAATAEPAAPPALSAPAATSAASKSGTRVAGALAMAGPDGLPKVSIPLETGSLQKQPTRSDAGAVPNPANPATSAAPGPSAPGQATAGSANPSFAAAARAQAALAAPLAAPIEPRGPAPVGPVVLNSTAAAAQAPATAPPKPFAVQLASGGSVESLRLSWSVLSEQHRDALGALQPRYSRSVSTAEAGPIYDLVAGPFKTAADARKACKTLATRGVDCKIGNFGGDGL